MKNIPFLFLFLILSQFLAVGCNNVKSESECKELPRSHFAPNLHGDAEDEEYDY